jgi:hypothetical protein
MNITGTPVTRPWRNALLVGLVLFALGWLDVCLRLWSFHQLNALSVGIEDVVNDPGKHFFHLVLLPLVGAYLFKNFPSSQLGVLLAKSKPFRISVVAIGCGLVVLAVYLVFSHEKEDFFRRCTNPEDLAAFGIRSNLFMLREKHKASLPLFGGEDYRTNALAALVKFNTEREAVFKTNNFKNSWGGLVTHRSLKAQVAALESLLAALTGAVVLWTALTFFLGLKLLGNKDGAPIESIHSFFSYLVAIMVWTPLKMYSEWYTHFKVLEDTTPAIANALVWLALCGLVFVGWLFSTKTIKWVYSGFSVLAVVLGLAFQAKPELFETIASCFYKGPPFLKFSIYFAATCATAVAMLSLSRSTTPPGEAARKQPTSPPDIPDEPGKDASTPDNPS